MSYKMPDLTRKRLQLSSNLRRLYMEKELSEHSIGMITSILKAEATQGTERRCQILTQITDLLLESKTEDEFLHKLRINFFETFNYS